MSNSGSESDSYESSSNSKSNFEGDRSDFHDEFEESATSDRNKRKLDPTVVEDDVDEGAYEDEPIVTSEWVAEYSKNQKKS